MRTVLGILKNVIVTSPFLAPLFLAVFTTVAVICLVLDFYNSLLIWTIGLPLSFLVSVASYKYVKKIIIPTKERLVYTSVAILVCLVWFIGNSFFSSQHVYVDRDPGIYTTAAIWLTNNDDLHIEKDDYVFGSPAVQSAGSGYGQSLNDSNELYAQGAHALPALLGLAGRIGGESFLLRINTLFGALALLSVFGFASLIVTRLRWALLGTLLLSVTLPLIYFSRDTYTEPLAMVFVFGALSLLFFAQKVNKKALWLATGIVTGATALVRIDAPLAIAGMLIGAFLAAFLSMNNDKKVSLRGVSVYIGTVFALYVLSLYDLAYLSSGYLSTLASEVKAQAAILAVIAVVGFLLLITKKYLSSIEDFYSRHKSKILSLVGYSAGAIILLMLSRPLWLTAHQSHDNPVVRALQAAAGLPVDGQHSYGEFSLEWMAWYIGAFTLLFALIGFVLIAINAFKSKNIVWFSFLAVVIGAAVVYLNYPNITADQIWASRRFLPVVIPGMIIAAIYTLSVMDDKKFILPKKYHVHVSVGLLFIAAACILGALSTTRPFVNTRTHYGQLGQVSDACKSIDKNGALLLVGDISFISVQPFRSICGDIPVAYLDKKHPLTSDILQTVNTNLRSSNKKLYIGSLGPNNDVLINFGIAEPFSSLTFLDYERTLISRPEKEVSTTYHIYLGEVTEENVVVPVLSPDR